MSGRLKALLVLAAIFGFAAYSAGEQKPSRFPTERFDPAPIDESVFFLYDKQNYPDTYATWGASNVHGIIQETRVAAAQHASKQPGCGRVLYSEFSKSRSEVGRVTAFADCENGDRYYVDQRGSAQKDRAW